MKIISSPNMPKSNGHYSQCIEHNGVLYLSGQLPFEPETRVMPEGIERQTKQVLTNVETILIEAGSCKSKVIQVKIYISNINDWEMVNRVYSTFFGNHKPVRCIIPTCELHYGVLIEVEVTAVL